MKKRIAAILSALTVMAMGSITVFGANLSPSTATAPKPVEGQTVATTVAPTESADKYVSETKVSEGFDTDPVYGGETTIKSAATAVQNLLLNDVKSIGEKLNNDKLKSAAADSKQKVSATLLSVVEVYPTSASRGADGYYTVTLKIDSIAEGDVLAILHDPNYNDEWNDIIIPTKVEKGAVTFKTKSLSPIAVVRLEVSNAVGAPKTGETAPAAVMLLAAACAAGVVVYRKKYLFQQ